MKITPSNMWVRVSKKAAAAHLICLALVANAFAVGIWGLDFGDHWDEWHLGAGLKNAINDASVLPREYTYGGMYYDVGFLLLLPRALPLLSDILAQVVVNPPKGWSSFFALDQYPAVVSAKAHLLSVVDSASFIFEARIAFLAISSFAAVWVYLILRRLFPGRALAHIAGAAYVTTSWEVGYLSRFITVDTSMMQLVALTFLCIIIALQRQDRAHILGWLGGAALCGGAAMGSKLPGLFLLLPILASVWIHSAPGFDRQSRALSAIGMTLIFVIAFILSTPGSLYDPIRFAATVIREAKSYNDQPPSYLYYVEGPLTHARLALLWLYGVVPSPWIPLAVPLSIVTAVGYWTLWRQHRPILLCMAAFALPHGLFVASTHLLLVRNWILYVPLIAIAFGAGVVTCYDLAQRFRLGWMVPSTISAIFICNIAWLWIAANSIRHRNPEIFAARLLDYMRDQAERDFRISPKLIELYNLGPRLTCSGAEPPSSDPSAAVVFLYHEQWPTLGSFSSRPWLANRPGFAERIISTNEVNYDYQPSWIGHAVDHRIVILRNDRTVRIGLASKDFLRCSVPSAEVPAK